MCADANIKGQSVRVFAVNFEFFHSGAGREVITKKYYVQRSFYLNGGIIFSLFFYLLFFWAEGFARSGERESASCILHKYVMQSNFEEVTQGASPWE